MVGRWRTGYDEAENERFGQLTATVNEEPSLTQQSFAVDADINVLVQRFGLTNIPVVPFDPSAYGDFSEAPDLREALEIMRDAKEGFAALPARVRRRFDNDPAELWEFLQDDRNREEAEQLGLVEARKPIVAPAGTEGAKAPLGDPPGEAGKA